MVNSQLQKEINDALKIDERVQKTPEAIPVVEVGTKSVKNITSALGLAYNATSGEILAATNQIVYITGLILSTAKDATATSTGATITATIDANLTTLATISGLTLTAQSDSIAISFKHPIKIDKNTAVNVKNTTNVGNVRTSGIIFYFIDEIN